MKILLIAFCWVIQLIPTLPPKKISPSKSYNQPSTKTPRNAKTPRTPRVPHLKLGKVSPSQNLSAREPHIKRPLLSSSHNQAKVTQSSTGLHYSPRPAVINHAIFVHQEIMLELARTLKLINQIPYQLKKIPLQSDEHNALLAYRSLLQRKVKKLQKYYRKEVAATFNRAVYPKKKLYTTALLESTQKEVGQSFAPKKRYLFDRFSSSRPPELSVTKRPVIQNTSDIFAQYVSRNLANGLLSKETPGLSEPSLIAKKFDYSDMDLEPFGLDKEKTLIATANFSDHVAFKYCGSDKLFAQDEQQVAEIPAIALYRQQLQNQRENQDLTKETHLIMGAHRMGQVNLYGHAFEQASLDQLKAKTTVFETPQDAHVFTMVASQQIHAGNTYNSEMAASLLLPALSAFINVKQAAKAQKKDVVIQTGLWGAGAFGHHPTASLAAQYVAAHLAKISDAATPNSNTLKIGTYIPSASVRTGPTSADETSTQEVVNQAHEIAQEVIQTLKQNLEWLPRNQLLGRATVLLARSFEKNQILTIGGEGT